MFKLKKRKIKTISFRIVALNIVTKMCSVKFCVLNLSNTSAGVTPSSTARWKLHVITACNKLS